MTAHEALDVLVEQVENVLFFCPESVVVIHLNASFRAAIDASPVRARQLRMLTERARVLLNPASFETRWAHMYHAHLSNLMHVETLGLKYGSLLLMSSADLVFRQGLEAYATGFDAGFDAQPPPSPWYWERALRSDPIAGEVLARSGRLDFVVSLHEGTFYKREIAVRILSTLRELIPDWDYGDTYVREEVFMPTLAEAAGARSIARSSAHVLGFAYGETDRRVMAQLLHLAGAVDEEADSSLAEWARENTIEDDPLAGKYIISRLPRRSDSPARMMIVTQGSEQRARARWIGDRLSPIDLAELDRPGRTTESQSRPSAVVLRTLVETAEPLFAFQRLRADERLDFEAPVRLGDFSGTVPLVADDPDQGFLCAFNNAGGVRVSIAQGSDGLDVEVSVHEASPRHGAAPFLFFGRALAFSRARRREIVAFYDRDGEGGYDLDFWFEVHRSGERALEKAYFLDAGLDRTTSHPVLRRWPLPHEVEEALAAGGQLGTAFVYMKLPVSPAKMRFHLLGLGY